MREIKGKRKKFYYNIKTLKILCKKKKNINQFLREKTNLSEKEIIKISYDLQSGSYIRSYNYKKSLKVLNFMIKEINSTKFTSLLDFGCGELTNFYTLIKNIKTAGKNFFCNDYSFNRIFLGKLFLDKKKLSVNLTCFTNDSIKIPLPDNSIDIVTTIHAIEPNKNDANKILRELWRVAKKKLILLEPNNKLTDEMPFYVKKIVNKRFKINNYVLNLEEKIKKITSNYKIIKLKHHFNPLNPASLFIINKNSQKFSKLNFLDPANDNVSLQKKSSFYFSEKTGRIFPIINNIICFNRNETFINNK
jgi:ubiquinone/menaquinone biosynthesis C-methylase UbiE